MLTVADPSATATGHLVNGDVRAAGGAPGQGGAARRAAARRFAAVGGAALPTQLLSYAAPVSNDAVSIGLKQSIGATDALRTGTYSKTLTFTLSTTTP